MGAPPSTDADELLPAPRAQLRLCGLTDADIDSALERAPQVRGLGVDTHPDARFDPSKVRRVLTALGALRHTKTRRWAGTPLQPDPWQVVWIIAPTFGWVDADGLRIVRELYVEIPRKNGKTTLSTGLSLVLLCADGEPGAEVYSAAVDRTQASRILDDAKKMVLASPELRDRAQPMAGLIKYPSTGGVMRALSKVAEAAHGLNVHGGVIDELHVHKTRDLVDAIVSGTGSRDQPLVIVITTADEGDDHTIYAEYHDRAEQQADRVAVDPSFYGIVWRAPEGADPFDEATIRAANPGYGTSLNPDVVADEVAKAQQVPSYLATYLRLRLNVRQKGTAGLVDMPSWNAAPCVQLHPDLTGRSCYAAFDLSSTTDFTAAALLFPPDPDGDDPMWDVIVRKWVPEDRLGGLARQCRVPLDRWRRDGWLHVTEGNVVDYEPLVSWLSDAAKTYDLTWVGYDRWNAGDTWQALAEQGIRVEPVGQGYQSLSSPSKLLDRLVRQQLIRHAGDPCLKWMANNLMVKRDDNDNIRPVKPDRQKAGKRIDGMVALITALFGYEHYGRTRRSVYETRGLEVV